jgi:hypothetical protein
MEREGKKCPSMPMWQFGNAAMRQTLREALGIGHWALPACAEPPGVTAGAPQRMARLPTLPHCRITKLPHLNDYQALENSAWKFPLFTIPFYYFIPPYLL